MEGVRFFEPTDRGFEAELRDRLDRLDRDGRNTEDGAA
jgi:hypothetical protein